MASFQGLPLVVNEKKDPHVLKGKDVITEMSTRQYDPTNDDISLTVVMDHPGKGFDPCGTSSLEKSTIFSTASTPTRSDIEAGETGDAPIDEKYFGFSDKSVRRGFIRKVYGVLFLQLSLTLAIGSFIFYNESLSGVLRGNFTFFWAMLAIIVVSLVILFCLKGLRRTPPFNYIFLALFTAAEAGLVGTAATAFESREVLIAVGVVTVLILFLTLFAFQSKWDFTLLFSLLTVILFVLCVFAVFLIVFPSRKTYFVYCGLIVLVFSVHVVFDTQLMIGGNHFFRITPEEYVVAALNLYMDILNLFLHLLVLIRS